MMHISNFFVSDFSYLYFMFTIVCSTAHTNDFTYSWRPTFYSGRSAARGANFRAGTTFIEIQ